MLSYLFPLVTSSKTLEASWLTDTQLLNPASDWEGEREIGMCFRSSLLALLKLQFVNRAQISTGSLEACIELMEKHQLKQSYCKI